MRTSWNFGGFWNLQVARQPDIFPAENFGGFQNDIIMEMCGGTVWGGARECQLWWFSNCYHYGAHVCDLWWYSARADMFPRVRGRVVEPVMFEAEEKKNKNKNKTQLWWFLYYFPS